MPTTRAGTTTIPQAPYKWAGPDKDLLVKYQSFPPSHYEKKMGLTKNFQPGLMAMKKDGFKKGEVVAKFKVKETVSNSDEAVAKGYHCAAHSKRVIHVLEQPEECDEEHLANWANHSRDANARIATTATGASIKATRFIAHGQWVTVKYGQAFKLAREWSKRLKENAEKYPNLLQGKRKRAEPGPNAKRESWRNTSGLKNAKKE